MRIQQFVVQFDNGLGVFAPGDEVSGQVFLKLAKSLKVRGVRLQIIGEAFSRWEYGKKNTSQSNSSYIYKEYEKYFDYRETLIGKDEHDNKAKNVSLAKGDHTFQFRYQLPTGEGDQRELPTSLEGAYGYVRYSVRALVDRPMKRNQWSLKPFSVIRPFDLNQEPTAAEPSDAYTQHKVRSKTCVCASGHHKMTLSLERAGFCPGEAILINARCENGTSKKILRTSADLLQVINYSGSKKNLIGSTYTKTRRTIKVIETVRGEGCGGHSLITWTDVPLVVPSVPPSRIDACNIIQVHYLLRLTAYLKSGKRVWCEAPIVIGTEPLVSSYAAYYGTTISCVVDRATSVSGIHGFTGDDEHKLDGSGADDSGDGAVECDGETKDSKDNDVFPLYTTVACPPPTYSECSYGGATITEDEYTMGQTVFVPLYRVYGTLRRQTTAIQASDRSSIVVEDLSPYRPIGVPVCVQVSESELGIARVDDEDEDESDPIMCHSGEDSETNLHHDMIERPHEPIMFEVHHEDARAASSAADSPAMMSPQTPAPPPDGLYLVYNDSCTTTPVQQHLPPTALQQNPDMDSDSEDEDLPADQLIPVSQDFEPQDPAPLFTEQVLQEGNAVCNGHAFEQTTMITVQDEIQAPECVGSIECGEQDEQRLSAHEPNDSISPISVDSNGIPVGAMVPLTNSCESVNSQATGPASEVFGDEPAAPPPPPPLFQRQESSVRPPPPLPPTEALEVHTDEAPVSSPVEEDGGEEPALCIAEPESYLHVNGVERISESDMGYEAFMASQQQAEDTPVFVDTSAPPQEELAIDTTVSPGVDMDSGASSNCAEFIVNPTPAAAVVDQPPEDPIPEETSAAFDPPVAQDEEQGEGHPPEPEQQLLESSSGGSSLMEPMELTSAAADDVVEAAIKEAAAIAPMQEEDPEAEVPVEEDYPPPPAQEISQEPEPVEEDDYPPPVPEDSAEEPTTSVEDPTTSMEEATTSVEEEEPTPSMDEPTVEELMQPQVQQEDDVTADSESTEGQDMLSEIEEEPSQDDQPSTPPPIPERDMRPMQPPPPIPSRAPQEEQEQEYLEYNDEPLSPIVERHGEETDDASPSYTGACEPQPGAEGEDDGYDEPPPPEVQDPGSDTGSYDLPAEQAPAYVDLQPIPHQSPLINIDGDENLMGTAGSSEAEDSSPLVVPAPSEEPEAAEEDEDERPPPPLPQRDPISSDDPYVSYGPGISGTLVSEHAENDGEDYMEDLMASTPPLREDPQEDKAAAGDSPPRDGSGSFSDEDGLAMQPQEQRESSDDVEERDCYGDNTSSNGYDSSELKPQQVQPSAESEGEDNGTTV